MIFLLVLRYEHKSNNRVWPLGWGQHSLTFNITLDVVSSLSLRSHPIAQKNKSNVHIHILDWNQLIVAQVQELISGITRQAD